MSSNSGDCFVVLEPHSEGNCVIFGRNSLQTQGVQEVVYFPPSDISESAKCDGGCEIDRESTLAVILARKILVWGAESGSNEKNVSIGITWSDGEPSESCLMSTDIVRLALERASSAEDAVNIIASLNSDYGGETYKSNFLICDPKEVWLLSLGGKLWAAEKLTSGFRRISSTGLAVTTKIDKSIEDLGDKLKDLGLWDGNDNLDFSKSFSSEPNSADTSTSSSWPIEEPSSDSSFGLTNMFEVLRKSNLTDSAQSSHVSTLVSSLISCHWFTATPNPNESVFKPFVFAPGARISPLTKIPDGEDTTLLHKLHAQRNWENVGDLLISLESTCVEEVKSFLSEHPTPTQELDELMKDCVEAEVKFYR